MPKHKQKLTSHEKKHMKKRISEDSGILAQYERERLEKHRKAAMIVSAGIIVLALAYLIIAGIL